MSDKQENVSEVSDAIHETQQLEAFAEQLPELNSSEEVSDEKELTEEEKRDILIQGLKQSKIRFRPIKHYQIVTTGVKITKDALGITHVTKEKGIIKNQTTNQFGTAYKKERRKKNKQQRASRRANRK